MRLLWTFTWLMVICAGLRVGLQPATSTDGGGLSGPSLPHTLSGREGVEVAMDASEALLAGMPGVNLQRRAYGESHVALVTAQGIRENHPPAVCLNAGGFEVMERSEEQEGRSCLVHLLVRRDNRLSHFYYSYLNRGGGEATGTCGYWPQLAAATWRRLMGRSGAWTTLQVMDRDAARAKTLIIELIRRTK